MEYVKPEQLAVIKQLEKETGKEITFVSMEAPRVSFDKFFLDGSCGFWCDRDGAIIRLKLIDAKLTDLSPLTTLTALTNLNLDKNQITDLSLLKKLNRLTVLNLCNNRIKNLSPLNDLTALTDLRLYGNQITDLSPLITLNALTTLNLVNNKITSISPLTVLTELTNLYLGGNQIKDLSPLKNLTGLTELNLDGNQIMDLSPLKNLTGLTELDLSENLIKDLSPLIPLTKLKRINARKNYITQLSPEWLNHGIKIKWRFDGNKGLFLENNPLESPPIEIVKQSNKAVRNYFVQIKGKKTVRLLESKLLIVGNGEVGKTSLMKKLKEPNCPLVDKEPTTHGINIIPWTLDCSFTSKEITEKETVKINLWDFGGQDIYHATHQFFLTKRSLYLFVWEARKEEESKSFDYWLNIIKLLSNQSPVIIVMNKSDIRDKEIDEASFKDKFTNIFRFHKVSCLSGKGIPELIEHIRTSFGKMDHLLDKLPKVWMTIRSQLKQENKNYINREAYFEICRKFGLKEDKAEFLSDYLHDLGSILHYQHDPLLRDTVILKPEWATEAVYKLIDTKTIQENKGRFQFDDLPAIWTDPKEYPRDKFPHLIRLMEKFELVFNIVGSTTYIVPELLAAQRPEIPMGKYRRIDTIHFEYHYDFMPEGIISRFISRMYYLIKDDHFWKNGVELTFEDAEALVVNEPLNRKIKISISNTCDNPHMKSHACSQLLGIIRNDFDAIHKTLNMEKEDHFNEMIPCNCKSCLNAEKVEKKHFYSYASLKKYIERGVNTFRCPLSIDEVSIEELLKGIEAKRPEKPLLQTLIESAVHLQRISKNIQAGEDDRNNFIATLLTVQQYNVKDQTRTGRSYSGAKTGEIDIMIFTPEWNPLTIIEAFNLKSFDATKIDIHLEKIFGYDANGLDENYIFVYCEAADFLGLWNKYIRHIKEINFKYPLKEVIPEDISNCSDIKLLKASHQRNGKQVNVNHLFIKMETISK